MKSIFVIAERELKTYFLSPIAYVVLAIFTFLSGITFSDMLGRVAQRAQMLAMQAAQTGQVPPPFDAPGEIAQSSFAFAGVVLLFMLPMITMGLFSEEKKRGTIELLLTAPITDLQVVLGKFVAAAMFYIVLLATTIPQLAALYMYSKPATGPILSAYLGLLLYGLAILALGMFISTLTENQIVAGILSFGMALVLWLTAAFAEGASENVRAVLVYLSIYGHLIEFLTGVVSSSHIIFYLSLTLVGLFLTYRSLDSLRWRG